MRTDRFSSSSARTAALLLAGLLLAADLPAAGRRIIQIGRAKISFDSPSKKLADDLARQVDQVKQGFNENRRALRTVPGPGGKPAYLRLDVAGLIVRAEKDLDLAIERIGEPGLDALRAWSTEELRPIHEELATPAGHTAVSFPGLSTPRAVGVVASLGWIPLPELASVKAAAPKKSPKKSPKAVAPKKPAPIQEPPQPATIPAEKANGLLDQVGGVIGKILFLAAHDDLEVKLWVSSTPARATFHFWPQGNFKGSAPSPIVVRTNGKRDHVLRGLYSYRAAWSKGAVTELVQYPAPADAPTALQASERLDLVKGSSFFCCRLGEKYCQHVENENDCRQ